ncbi:MAG: 50S ribosomal protein L3 [Deltaproteobacteria bacterium]|nr:50S ribosomal protein L3 [Deltaproteobacteria bacterium]
MAGILAKKIGCTQIFTKDGRSIPVTVLQAGPCVVIQKKTQQKEGYSAVQLGFDEVEFRKLNKALKGHFQKKEQKAYRLLKEFRVEKEDSFNVGDVISSRRFKTGDFLDVTGVSKGKGFQGVIKRHHKAGGPKTHGSGFHRTTGSIGQRTYPGKVFKNMKLPGHMGDRQVTIKNLELMEIRPEENLLFVQGSVPGANEGYVVIRNQCKDFEQRKEDAQV